MGEILANVYFAEVRTWSINEASKPLVKLTGTALPAALNYPAHVFSSSAVCCAATSNSPPKDLTSACRRANEIKYQTTSASTTTAIPLYKPSTHVPHLKLKSSPRPCTPVLRLPRLLPWER